MLHFCWMHKNMRGLATDDEHIFINDYEPEEERFAILVKNVSSFCMKLAMGSSVIGGNLLRMKDFTLVILVSLTSDISLKLNKRPH